MKKFDPIFYHILTDSMFPEFFGISFLNIRSHIFINFEVKLE